VTPADKLEAPAEATPLVLADWLEAYMLLSGSSQLGSAEIRRLLRDHGLIEDLDDPDAIEGEGGPTAPTAASRDDAELDGVLNASPVIEMLLQEIDRRREIAPCVYPWELAGQGVGRCAPQPQAGVAYEFLLWLALEGTYFRRKRKWTEAEWAFDHIVLTALRGYLGPASKALAFARPRSARQGPGVRPVSFPKAVSWLAAELRLEPGWAAPRARRNDGGIDVVAWRPFKFDPSPACPFFLVQCTFRKDWHHKGRDIVLDTWRSWITFRKDPITVLAVPFCMSDDDERRDEVETEVWLLLDRLRLCELLCEVDASMLADLEKLDLDKWLVSEISRFDPTVQEADEDDDKDAEDPYQDVDESVVATR
jgi:hypothetical protein